VFAIYTIAVRVGHLPAARKNLAPPAPTDRSADILRLFTAISSAMCSRSWRSIKGTRST